MRKCLINVDGGMGKNVMLTSIMPILKEKYGEIYVISPYFDIFKACSYVTDAFQPGIGALYQELVLDPECDVLWKEPYSNSKFIKKECHLFDSWLVEFGFAPKGTEWCMGQKPILDRIEQEFPIIAAKVDEIISSLGDNFSIVQFSGGHSPLESGVDQNGNPIKYYDKDEPIKRNYFNGQQIVDKILEKDPETKILHFALKTENDYPGTQKLEIPYLAYHLLAARAKRIICTDSSLQHLSTGVCDNVTVIWGETRPEHFGYNCNKNICAKNVINSQPYFKPLGVSPSIVRMPSPDDVISVSFDEKEEKKPGKK